MTEQTTFPIRDLDTIRGIDNDYVVDWVEWDLAEIKATGGEVLLSFASDSDCGFVTESDVVEQAREIVAEWDMLDFEVDFE